MNSKPTIFFFCCPQGPPEAARYQYGIIPLAEGLRKRGCPIYSNVDYWHLSPGSSDFLFPKTRDVSFEDCDIVVLNDRWFRYGNLMPSSFFQKRRNYLTAYVDCADGVFTRTFKPGWHKFDVVFKAHYNQRIRGIPTNVKPWAFGMTERILTATDADQNWTTREPVFLSNFRVEHPLRNAASEILHPMLSDIFKIDNSTDGFVPPSEPLALFEWERTGRRHNLTYYEKLKSSQAASCFGGKYAHRWATPVNFRKIFNRIEKWMPCSAMALYQWDSFRFWETFAAGCLVFHVDLKQQGCLLPVMPRNGVEYIGVDLKNPTKTREWILDVKPVFADIAYRGKQWALKNYSPSAMANRFLSELGYSEEFLSDK